MSTIKADNIATLAGVSTSMANAVNGSAKAWVNFNGTGTVAIRAQYNVSSITDNGTGQYTVNFTTAMPDSNYAAIAESALSTANTGNDTIAHSTVSASSTQVLTNNPVTAAPVDSALVHVAVFR